LGHQKSQAMQTKIACEIYQEGRKDTQTNQGRAGQDCIHDYPRKSGAIIHANNSTEGEHCMKTDYEQYLEWCRRKGLAPISEEEEKKYGIWNSIRHLKLTEAKINYSI